MALLYAAINEVRERGCQLDHARSLPIDGEIIVLSSSLAIKGPTVKWTSSEINTNEVSSFTKEAWQSKPLQATGNSRDRT